MKKLFIYLGVITLSMSLVSCKEENKYEEYENSEKLNEMLLEKNYIEYVDNIAPYLNTIDIILEGRRIYKTYFCNDIKDYYICGYFDNSIKETLENMFVYVKNANDYSVLGKGQYILAWNIAVREKDISSEEFPIYWYTIPKSEEVPKSMNDKFLVAVLESVNVIYESLEDDDEFETEMLFESSEFYEKKYTKWYDKNEMLKKESIHILTEKGAKNLKEGFTLVEYYFANTALAGRDIKYFNEIPCVTFGNYNDTIYHDEDLKDKYEYFESENGNIYFKLNDIMEVFGRK